ncbi:PREDICTED: uncharacterized protein LOC101365005 [Odobenus rosmarus divergens]|uniref:Protein BRICK1 n=1 Tax=Odobenus rosmarus divergens TaxID=9708 RepID=A0A9B0GQD6_ODORO
MIQHAKPETYPPSVTEDTGAWPGEPGSSKVLRKPQRQVLFPLRIHSPQPGSALPGSGSALPGSGLALRQSCTRRSRALPLRPSALPPPPPTCYSPPELHPHWPSPPAPPYPSSGWSVSLEGRGHSPQRIGPGVAGRGGGAGSRGPAGGGALRAGRQGATGGHFGGVMVGGVWPPPPGPRRCPLGHLLALAGKQPSVSAVLDGNLCLDRFLPFTSLHINQIALMSFCRGYLPGPQNARAPRLQFVSLLPSQSRSPYLLASTNHFPAWEERLGYILRISQKGEQDSRNKGECVSKQSKPGPRGKGKVCVLELKLEDQIRSEELKLSQITLVHHIVQPAKKKGDSEGWRLCKPVLELLELSTNLQKNTAVAPRQVAVLAGQEDPVQRESHQDWANQEYTEVITSSIEKIADFLNSFDMSCHSRLATLNEKLTALERRIEYIEARLTKGETLT